MGKYYLIFKEKKTDLNIFEKILHSFHGVRDVIDGKFIVKNTDAILWIGNINQQVDEDFYCDEILEIRNKFNLCPHYVITIELSSDEGSNNLCLKFCQEFCEYYSDAIIMDSNMSYYSYN